MKFGSFALGVFVALSVSAIGILGLASQNKIAWVSAQSFQHVASHWRSPHECTLTQMRMWNEDIILVRGRSLDGLTQGGFLSIMNPIAHEPSPVVGIQTIARWGLAYSPLAGIREDSQFRAADSCLDGASERFLNTISWQKNF